MASPGCAHAVRFDAQDEVEVANYVATTGEPYSAVLARATLRGIRAERLERGLLLYITDHDLDAAAAFAGLPRAIFIDELLNHGITILDGNPGDLLIDLERLDEHIEDSVAP
jgi:hypothetical protein